jgi:hypothetical protein
MGTQVRRECNQRHTSDGTSRADCLDRKRTTMAEPNENNDDDWSDDTEVEFVVNSDDDEDQEDETTWEWDGHDWRRVA